ncbi:hypothetical protein EJ04DRAFT_516492 [Polyplosphaeria fusca]|uniref:Uncharacterized protein n=1 Tax=Polyplosphaeria fusca TaxID=682080 RepID=A0A9P4UU75_9PLEO|nr:hypothetical protein EJ04DRAFT_516492 [Polyplosphaeria fusca]
MQRGRSRTPRDNTNSAARGYGHAADSHTNSSNHYQLVHYTPSNKYSHQSQYDYESRSSPRYDYDSAWSEKRRRRLEEEHETWKRERERERERRYAEDMILFRQTRQQRDIEVASSAVGLLYMSEMNAKRKERRIKFEAMRRLADHLEKESKG